MILGNAGIVTVIVTATSSLVTSKGYQISLNAMILIGGAFLIYKIATHRGFVRRWESFIEDKFLRTSVFEERMTEDLLHLIEGYGLLQVMVTENPPLIGSTLAEQVLPKKELLVLGIERGRAWIPASKSTEPIEGGDKLVVYGSLNVLKGLFGEQ